MPVFEDLRDASPQSIRKLNDMMRYLYKKVQGGITHAELAPEVLDDIATVDAEKLVDNAITADKIGDGQINGGHIEEASIGTAHIEDAAITNAKIDRASVDKLVVTTADIADANITAAKIADANITTAKIENAQITTAKIADLAVTNVKIDHESVDRLIVGDANIAELSVTEAKIANEAVTSSKIANGTILTAHIGDAQITQEQIAYSSIINAHIQDAAIESAKIKSIEADLIKSGTLDAGNITVQNLDCESLTVNTINGSQISKGAITGGAAAVSAAVSLGYGEEGIITIKRLPGGSAGNEITVIVENGAGTNQPLNVNYDSVEKHLTITLATDASGNPNDAANISELVAAAMPTGLSATVNQAGVMVCMAEPKTFEGGEDGIIAPGTITGQNIAYIEADCIRGGDLTLGGTVNESTYDGRIVLKRADNSTYGEQTRNGMTYYDSTQTSALGLSSTGISVYTSTMAKFSLGTRAGIGIFVA
jgi:hypothetical protein